MRRFWFLSGAVAVAGIAATIATYSRYESFDPCVWMEQDMAHQSRLPRVVMQGRIRADFLIQGVSNPDRYQCLTAWWKFRANGGVAQ